MRDRRGEAIYIEERWWKEDGTEENSSVNIAALYGESVFHEDGDIEIDGLEEGNYCVNFGQDPKMWSTTS